ncbi:MAG: right-handed parallel beta-helix repeat-containing protein [Deltaproteobacteria bacterium]|nr:right-handed parallel beta-helix repeat-containing protein [Deltaproteobacteria bacterium]
MRSTRLPAILILLTLSLTPSLASAATVEINPGDDLLAALNALSPGDELVIHAGDYPTGRRYGFTLSGTAAAPILVHGADGEARPVIRGIRSQNIFDLDGSYFTLAHLEFDGGSHGIRLGSTDHANLEDLVIHNTGDVAISCNRSGEVCDSIAVRDTEIYDTGADGGTGEGFYLGCNDNSCRITNWIIERNYVHDTRAGAQGDGIELKTGSFGNIIRNNVIVRTGYPGILISGFPEGAGPNNLVEGNLVWDTMDNGIQLTSQVTARNNIVIGAGAGGITSQAHQGFEPHATTVVHNTVINAGGACFRGNQWASQTGNVLANNAFFCMGGTAVKFAGGEPATSAATLAGNITLGALDGASRGMTAAAGLSDFVNASAPDLYPASGSTLIDAGDASLGAMFDFDGSPRDDGSPDAGAYEWRSGGSAAWPLSEAFKVLGMTPPPMDGGVPPADAGTPGDDGGRPLDAGALRDTGTPGDEAGAPPTPDAGTGGSSGGCGCVIATGHSARPIAAMLLLGLGIFLRRRRR